MKKQFKTGIMALALAAGTIGAFAMSPAPAKAKSGDTIRHFFDAVSGAYIGPRLESVQKNDCGEENEVDCAYGYDAITGSGPTAQPSGPRKVTIQAPEE